MECKICGRSNATDDIILQQCRFCKRITKNLKTNSPGKIKVALEKNVGGQSITILANEGGLKYLASCCLAVIGKNDPSGHFHLESEFNNLTTGSVPLVIGFSNDPVDYANAP